MTTQISPPKVPTRQGKSSARSSSEVSVKNVVRIGNVFVQSFAPIFNHSRTALVATVLLLGYGGIQVGMWLKSLFYGYPFFTLPGRYGEAFDTNDSPIQVFLVLAFINWWSRRTEEQNQNELGPFKAFVYGVARLFGGILVFNLSLFLIALIRHGRVKGAYSLPFEFRDLPMLILDPILCTIVILALRLVRRAWTRRGDPRDLVERGTEVIRSASQALAAFQARIHASAKLGLALHPALRIPLAMESRHLLLIGAPGSGKTQVLFPWLEDVVRRGWPTILYDFKGDYTAAYGEKDFAAILSPFDARGAAWDIAQDIDTTMRAAEFAAQLIPHHGVREPFFRQAAQDLLTGVLVKLQQERPLTWTLDDLLALLARRDLVVDACRAYRPAALSTIGAVEDRQASGIFGEVRTSTMQLEYLANAWRGVTRKISLRSWVNGATETAPQLIILRGSQEYRELDGFFTALVFSLLAKNALSLGDSYERQIWAFLDEFGNLPRVDGFDKLLTAVRSKGLRVVCAIQDIAQIEATYGRPFTQTFFGAFGTVLGGLTSGDTAAFLSRAYGQNQIARTITSSTSGGKPFQDSSTTSESIVIEHALLDSEFSGLTPPGLGRPAVFWLKTAGWPIGPLAYDTKPTPTLYPGEVANERLLTPRPLEPAAGIPITNNQGEIPRLEVRQFGDESLTTKGE